MESSGGKEGPKAPEAKDSPDSGEPVTTEIEAVTPKPQPDSDGKDEKKAKPKATKPEQGEKASKAEAGKKASKDPSRDVWFRLSTRVRAVGYWLREKLQAAGRGAGRGRRALRGLLAEALDRGRVADRGWGRAAPARAAGQGGAGAGVPARSRSRSVAPAEESFELVPADALLYAHLTIDEGSDQFERSGEAFEQLSDLRTILTAELPGALPTPSGTPVDISQDVLPWAERDLALTLLPGPGKSSLPAFVAGVEDQAGAEAFLAKVAPRRRRQDREGGRRGDERLRRRASRPHWSQDSLVFGEEPAVRASRSTPPPATPRRWREAPRSRPSARSCPRPASPSSSCPARGCSGCWPAAPGAATQLETFVDYGATDGLAAAAVAKDDGIEVDLVSSLNPKLLKQNPSFFSELPTFEPTLTSEAGRRSIAYAGVGEVGPTLTELLERAAEARAAWRARCRASRTGCARRPGWTRSASCCPRSAGRRRWSPSPPTAFPSPA